MNSMNLKPVISEIKISNKLLRIVVSVSIFMFPIPCFTQNQEPKQVEYIEKYKYLAIHLSNKYKVPVCIILSQALLESNAGTSKLAINGKNHFGIKDKPEWTGEIIHYKGENYRRYSSIEASYFDHSLFLTQRTHYEFLFKLDPTDYKGWAYGLRKAGYATDQAYPQKLIKIIETYKLHLL